MEPREISFSCPMDCAHACGLIALIKDGEIISISGDKSHPVTRGLTCRKSHQILQRRNHRDRLLTPKRKVNGSWVTISYEEALNEIAEKLSEIKQKYGSQAVMHYSDYGYGGISKKVDRIFFNHYGGVSVARGGLCLNAGQKAQEYDMGSSQGYDARDLVNARTILLWGRNPADTSVHFARDLSEARKRGAKIYLIDPIETRSAKLAHEYLSIRPGTDGALALGMARILIEEHLIDHDFIQNHSIGYEAFIGSVEAFTPEYVEQVTGIRREKIREMALAYGTVKPSAICMGYGIQRYENGGNTVRAIDALGALTGNIGISGGGVNYSNGRIGDLIGRERERSQSFACSERSFSQPKFADFVLKTDDPPVKMLLVSKANPLVQLPDIHQTQKAFEKIDFKVTIDMFMTDTALYSDLVLPASSVLEEEDFMYSSTYLNHSNKVVDAPELLIGEYELFRILARKMGLTEYPDMDRDDFFKRELQVLMEAYRTDYDTLRDQYFVMEGLEVAWNDRVFTTPSTKYEFFSQQALLDGGSPLPVYIPVKEGSSQYPLRLLTPHHRDSMHSQGFVFTEDRPIAYVNRDTLEKYRIDTGKNLTVSSERGAIQVNVEESGKIPSDTVVIYQGWWHKSGSVNTLVPDAISDMGELAAYFECFCRIENTKREDNQQ